jgi:hypothetical protein
MGTMLVYENNEHHLTKYLWVVKSFMSCEIRNLVYDEYRYAEKAIKIVTLR